MSTLTPPAPLQDSDWAVGLPERFDTHRRRLLDGLEPVAGECLRIDGSAVTFADHEAIAALIGARLRFLDAGGDLRMTRMSDVLRVTVELTGDAPLLEDSHAFETREVVR